MNKSFSVPIYSLLAPCPQLPLLPFLCLPFFFYLTRKAFIHSSSTFLRLSKEKEIYSSCRHPSKDCKVLRKWQEAWLPYFSTPSSSFLCLSFGFRLLKFGEDNYWIFVQFYNLLSHLGLDSISRKTLNVGKSRSFLNLLSWNNTLSVWSFGNWQRCKVRKRSLGQCLIDNTVGLLGGGATNSYW